MTVARGREMYADLQPADADAKPSVTRGREMYAARHKRQGDRPRSRHQGEDPSPRPDGQDRSEGGSRCATPETDVAAAAARAGR